MTKLFIIGNGFDLAHGLSTNYIDFRDELESKPQDSSGTAEYISYENPHAEYEIDEKVANYYIYEILSATNNTDSKWEHFEENLAYLDLGIIDDDVYVQDYPSQTDENYSSVYRTAYAAFGHLVFMFQEWISNLDSSEAKAIPDYSTLLSNEDIYINFNYTDTLENLYGIPEDSILHIHGSVNESPSELIVGHEPISYDDDDDIPLYPSQQDGKRLISASLTKDTDRGLKNLSSFQEISNFSDVTDIFPIGFSFSDVDMVYFDPIFQSLENPKNTVVHFSDFDKQNNDVQEFKNNLLKAGYKGKFK